MHGALIFYFSFRLKTQYFKKPKNSNLNFDNLVLIITEV